MHLYVPSTDLPLGHTVEIRLQSLSLQSLVTNWTQGLVGVIGLDVNLLISDVACCPCQRHGQSV